MIKTLLILYINRWKQQRGSMALTTLSIALSLITLSIISFHYSRLASPIYPEYNKESARYFKHSVVNTSSGVKSSGDMIYYTTQNLNTKIIEAVEGVAEIITFTREEETKGRFNNRVGKIGCREVSANIFNYLQFEFIAGKPFLDSDRDKAYIPAVITDKLSMEMFGTVESVGEYIELPRIPKFMVYGVVREAPNSDTFSADCYSLQTDSYSINRSDFLFISDNDTITEQLNNRLQKLADSESQKSDRYKYSLTTRGSIENGLWPILRLMDGLQSLIWLLLAIFILIPIICLYNILSSSLKYRISELGVRRSFGANRGDIMVRLIIENIISVIIGGVGGIILSLIVIMRLYDLTLVDVLTIYFQWRMILGSTLLFLLVGVLSGLIPAYRASRQTIVSSINNK